jgi:(p)ppGpp synthase/HD superfamily hydrolase
MENKESFHSRLRPYLSPSQQLDVKLAYVLAKFGHRSQVRKEISNDGTHVRYFEHVRRVAIILIDEMKIIDRSMIIAALLHDSIEDTIDITSELLEHSFGNEVVSMVKLLSKDPKEGYMERLSNCNSWEVLAIKACDGLDNLRSLMSPGTNIEFQKKQIKETKEKYYPLFDKLVIMSPNAYKNNVMSIRDEIKKLVERYSLIIELHDKNFLNRDLEINTIFDSML